MPEGHTLHRLARDHQRRFGGLPVIVSSPQGRFAAESARLDGRTFHSAEAWGKHLWHRYEGDLTVHVHLGLFGKFRNVSIKPDGPPDPVGQVRMRLVGSRGATDLRGPTDCSLVTEEQVDEVLARLGPDPLRADATPDSAWRRISRSRRAIGALLMDQKVMAGVGNVYRAEVLFRCGIDPHREGRDITRDEFDAIWGDLVELMPIGVQRGRIHVLRPEHEPDGPARGRGRPRTYVYRRTGRPCLICGTPVRTEVMDARNLYWCPVCQS